MKYHESGTICEANVKACPLGLTESGHIEAENLADFENKLAERYSSIAKPFEKEDSSEEELDRMSEFVDKHSESLYRYLDGDSADVEKIYADTYGLNQSDFFATGDGINWHIAKVGGAIAVLRGKNERPVALTEGEFRAAILPDQPRHIEKFEAMTGTKYSTNFDDVSADAENVEWVTKLYSREDIDEEKARGYLSEMFPDGQFTFAHYEGDEENSMAVAVRVGDQVLVGVEGRVSLLDKETLGNARGGNYYGLNKMSSSLIHLKDGAIDKLLTVFDR